MRFPVSAARSTVSLACQMQNARVSPPLTGPLTAPTVHAPTVSAPDAAKPAAWSTAHAVAIAHASLFSAWVARPPREVR